MTPIHFIIIYQRKTNLAFLITEVFLQDELVSDEYPRGSETESDSESLSVMATSQESEPEPDSARSLPSESESEWSSTTTTPNHDWQCGLVL